MRYVRWDDLDPDTVLVDQDGEVVDILAEAERQGVARDGSPWEEWIEAGAIDRTTTPPPGWSNEAGDIAYPRCPYYDNGRVIDGEVADPRTRCAHVAGRVRTFVPGRGPRETCERCGAWVAGVRELGSS